MECHNPECKKVFDYVGSAFCSPECKEKYLALRSKALKDKRPAKSEEYDRVILALRKGDKEELKAAMKEYAQSLPPKESDKPSLLENAMSFMGELVPFKSP
jgi:hypothetical protein